MQNNQTFVKTIGYRYVELVQDDVSDGKTFYFKINGTYSDTRFVYIHISIYVMPLLL